MGQRITFISMGQTPRNTLIKSILEHIDMSCEVTEFGALDGLTRTDITELEPSAHEVGISTLLNDGTAVAISESWLRLRVNELCQGRGKSLSDLTVIASTGAFDVGNTNEFVIHSQNTLDQFMETMIIAGQTAGKIVPLSSQPYRFGKSKHSFATEISAGSGDIKALENAADKLKYCDFLILSSMGYTNEDRQILCKFANKPVILAHRIVAGVINKILKQSSPTSNGDKLLQGGTLSNRLKKLTKRERQVFEYVLDGLGNKEIGRNLEISYRTVEIHRARMLAKMGVSNSQELMRLILQNISKAKANSIN
ncbi:AroM family protein [Sneathiella sp.]|jgi:protein AroM|uniref:AroM family protein n=1 Tax=Sneathiella sp. TaxID=1964365 RepID=UPI0039E62783